jgi:hypothetical protein
MMLRPFFPYYGSKWELSRKGAYPEPTCEMIIEAFAGAAGYSHHYPERRVMLVEQNPVVARVWALLIAASEGDILGLPSDPFEAAELPPSPARDLVGFWLARGRATAAKTPSSWLRCRMHMHRFWGMRVQERIVRQLPAIRHWTVVEGDALGLVNREATWFVDPPYSGRPGLVYRRFGSAHLDYATLAEWCRGRRGQVIVTEGSSATWLPFRPLNGVSTLSRRSAGPADPEAVWLHPEPEPAPTREQARLPGL